MNQEYKTGKEYMDELDEEQLRLFVQRAQNDMQKEMAEIEERSRKQFCKEIMPLLKPLIDKTPFKIIHTPIKKNFEL